MERKFWNIGDRVECICNDNAVIPVYVGLDYTITDMIWESKFEIWCIFIDNHDQCYDEVEFGIIFKKKLKI